MTRPVGDFNGQEQPPTASQVNFIHRFSDKDGSEEAQHHSLGPDSLQAAAGNHSHNGRDSADLSARYFRKGTPPTVSGSRGANAALEDLLIELHALGIINNQTIA